MECNDVLMGLAKHTIALGSSSFDMGSDLVNGLSFLGYFKLTNENVTASNSSFSLENDINTTIAISEVPSDNIENQVHQIWGILSIILIFPPGFVLYFPEMIGDICDMNWCNAFFMLVFSIFFPVVFISIQLYTIIMTCLKKEVSQRDQTFITRMTAAEAGLESTGQLMLQIFTILNGFPSNWIQKVTIVSSFLQIGRSVILQDIEVKILIKKEESLTFFQSLKETLKRIPIYVPTIVFRAGSLVVTIAYLRIYSIIPIFILLIELGWVSWKRFEKLSYRGWAMQYTAQLMISNVGVLNSYAFSQVSTDKEDEESIKRFVVQSTLITFIHHTSILVIMMVIGYTQPPESFITTLIVEPGSEDFYLMIGCVIAIGVLSLAINLCYFKWDEISKCCKTKTESVDKDAPIELQEDAALETENA